MSHSDEHLANDVAMKPFVVGSQKGEVAAATAVQSGRE